MCQSLLQVGQEKTTKNVVKKPAAGKHYIYCAHFPHILKSIINNTSGQTTFRLLFLRLGHLMWIQCSSIHDLEWVTKPFNWFFIKCLGIVVPYKNYWGTVSVVKIGGERHTLLKGIKALLPVLSTCLVQFRKGAAYKNWVTVSCENQYSERHTLLMGVLQCKGCDNNASKHWWDYESWHREGWTFLTSINESIFVCINILLSILPSPLPLQHHQSLTKRVAAFHNSSFAAVITYHYG